MEIRTLRAGEREALLDLLDGWEVPDGWRGRDFFRRYIEIDPTYSDENVWVAVDGTRLVSCVQIFPRRIRVLGHPVPTGGIGSVFTARDRRKGGLASALLESASQAMIERGMELSLLFSGLHKFYGRYGWHARPCTRTVVQRSRHEPPQPADDSGLEITPFERERDFAQVKSIHGHYSASRSGTVVRNDALWEASLVLAGNPEEEFLVARQGGELVAYLRTMVLADHMMASELGRRDGGSEALAALIDASLGAREGDPLERERRPSEALRRYVVLPAFDDLQLTLALEHRAIASEPFDDPSNMLRCLDMQALSRRLGIEIFEDETPDAFLARILPPDGFVFWQADRF